MLTPKLLDNRRGKPDHLQSSLQTETADHNLKCLLLTSLFSNIIPLAIHTGRIAMGRKDHTHTHIKNTTLLSVIPRNSLFQANYFPLVYTLQSINVIVVG